MRLLRASFWTTLSFRGKQSSRWLSSCFMPVVVQRQVSGVQAERESLFMRQSTVAFERISCISCSRCSHLEIWRIISSWLRLWAWLDSGYMFYISNWLFGRFEDIFNGEVDSEPEVFFLRSHAEWRSVLRRCLRCLEIGKSMHELHVAGRVHDEGKGAGSVRRHHNTQQQYCSACLVVTSL